MPQQPSGPHAGPSAVWSPTTVTGWRSRQALRSVCQDDVDGLPATSGPCSRCPRSGSTAARRSARSPHRSSGRPARRRRSFGNPILCAWAADDHVFPLDHARRYAHELGADLRTIDDSYTYTAEDQSEHTAQVLADWLDKP